MYQDSCICTDINMHGQRRGNVDWRNMAVDIKLLPSLGQSAEIVFWCTYFSVLQFIIGSWLCNYPSKMSSPII